MGVEIASPLSKNLDIHVRYTTITSIIRDGLLILFRLTGGVGFFPGWEANCDVTDINATIQCPEGAEELAARYEGQLIEWRDAGTPLEMWGEEGKLSGLGIPNRLWLPIPRDNPPPDEIIED